MDNVTTKAELVEGFKTPLSKNGKLYRLTELNYYFKDDMPFCTVKFKLEGENVRLSFDSNPET